MGTGVHRALAEKGYQPSVHQEEDGAFRVGELVASLPALLADPASTLYAGRSQVGAAVALRARKLRYLLKEAFGLELPARNPGNAVLGAMIGTHRGDARVLPLSRDVDRGR